MENQRRDLLDVYRAALQRVDGEQAVAHWLDAYELPPGSVIAIGKAAPAMMRGALKSLGDRLCSGLVITPKGYADPALENIDAIEQTEAAHPVPDESSLVAGKQLLTFIRKQSMESNLLFLISGGASSLVEVPVQGIDLEALKQLNRWMLANGLDIHAMNALRRRISRIKGGGLLDILQGRDARVLLISDVPGDDPSVIGSGLLHPPLDGAPENTAIPDWLTDMLPEESVRQQDAPPHHLVATSSQAVAAAAERGAALGYKVWMDYPPLRGDAAAQGTAFARMLQDAPAGLHVMGGETTVTLPDEPGRGGRNQHLALAAARVIAGREDLLILAAGTDGSDGPGGDAGALVDGGTWQRALDEGLDPGQALVDANSGRILEVAGDLIHTGPTNTNVMDLLIGLKLS